MVAGATACNYEYAPVGTDVGGAVGARDIGTAGSGLAGAGGAMTAGAGGAGNVKAALGKSCLAADEYEPAFSGFDVRDVNVDGSSPLCASGTCLVNHFQGRASCPYGELTGGTGCYVPGSDSAITVPVLPQLVSRPADQTSICSCRCDGPGPGPFCSCPQGMQCTHLIDSVVPNDTANAGSYCIPNGSEYVPPVSTEQCDSSSNNCGDPRPY
ncbi:MAG TPA: hypothetical protein VGI10_13575 [Polyangiaceae bacterium]